MKILNYISLLLISVTLVAETISVSSALEINNAMGGLNPGDTLLMSNGIWADQRISFHANGSEAQPIVLIAETPGQVVLSGFSTLEFSGSYIEINGLNFTEGYSTGDAVIEFRRNGVRANHCRLTNTTIFNYNPTSISTNYKWVSMYGQYNRVDHCYFAGKSHDAATFVVWLSEELDRDNHHIIEYNHFGYRPELGFNGGETIRIGTSTWSMTNSRTIVRHNLFERCDGEIEIISNKSCENIYFNNTFLNNSGTLTLRHGNRCLVEGNFFFGEGNSEAGGIRIIGEDHTVINNYLENLVGDGYRAAISMVVGVENSPLNRYFQVQNALVAHNTIINCRQSFMLGYASSSDQSMPPINCTISNNAVYSWNTDIFHFDEEEDHPQNFSYAQNIVFGGDLGMPDTSSGIIWQDPLFEFADEELTRPQAGSPLIGQAAILSYDVTTDMDGQNRGTVRDIGADQVSNDPILYLPLTSDDVGPDWTNAIAENIYVEEGLNNLADAIENLLPGDTIFLSGSEFTLDEAILVDRDILILPDPAVNTVPVLRPVDSYSRMFDILGGNTLRIKGVNIDGGGDSENRLQRIFHARYDNPFSIYSLFVEDCIISGIGTAGDMANILEGEDGTKADSIVFRSCTITAANGELFILDDTEDESGLYSANNVRFEDCTFSDVSGTVLSIYGGDTNPFSSGPVVMINHCTFYHCGYDNETVIDARNVDGTTIQNCIFAESSQSTSVVELYSWSQIKFTNVYASGEITLYPNVTLGEGMLYEDPAFANAPEGDFTLTPESVLYDHPGTEGVAYGDRRWHDPNVHQSVEPQLVRGYDLIHNYPNPFNGSTNLQIELESNSALHIDIYDLTGRLISSPHSGFYLAGSHTIQLDLGYLESGLYLCSVKNDVTQFMTKMTVLK